MFSPRCTLGRRMVEAPPEMKRWRFDQGLKIDDWATTALSTSLKKIHLSIFKIAEGACLWIFQRPGLSHGQPHSSANGRAGR